MSQKSTNLMMETYIAAYEESAEVAIVGMAGRFPGADDVNKFWQNLRDGVDAITDFSDQELLAAGVDEQTLKNPNYVKSGAVLSDIEGFDAKFFGLNPREAQVLDPQHRLFLEATWHALETAGYDPGTYKGSIGVFAGAAISDYVLNNLYPNREIQETLGRGFTVLSNDKDALTTRAAYLLDLTGPCCSVQTYCSTSLVAVGLACESLVSGESDIAFAGGVALNVPHHVGYMYQEGGITSPDGRCRAFDAKAKGSPLGSGVAVVALKRLADAVADGDTIYAVIKGWAVNNDGAMRTGFTAPGVRGQARVVLEALSHAEVDAESIDYIETHGTGTALGDAVEFAALLKSFSEHTEKKGFCAVGSVKTNIGHLDRAAGVTGLIKTALALKNELIPPTLHYEEPNPEIDFSQTPFYVNRELRPWQRNGHPRRAGVSSFGMGGTNAHVILEEAPQLPFNEPTRPYQVLLLSAKTKTALAAAAANLRRYLQENPEADMADVAYTLQVGRKAFSHRQMLVCQGREDVLECLASGDPTRVWQQEQVTQTRPFAFMFSGVGDQYPQMAQELCRFEPVFREAVDTCCRHLQPLLGVDLRDIIYPEAATTGPASGLDLRQMLGRGDETRDEKLNQAAFAQPAVFVIEFALAQLLQSWGIEPGALIGYSLGEYVAACVAGVLSVEDALTLVARRAQLIQGLPAGRMLAVPMSEEAIQPYLNDEICLAIINGQANCVLSGLPEALRQLEETLTAQEIACRPLETSHAFHSTMMTPIVEEFTDLVRSVSLHPPQIPYLSNVTGEWITPEQATDPTYWAQHLCQTVRFGAGLAELLADKQQLLIEIGPGQSLCSFAKQHPDCAREQISQILPTLPYVYNGQSDMAFLLTTLGKVWLQGQPVDWAGFYGTERRQRIPLPTYPFEHQRYWIDPPKGSNKLFPLEPEDKGKKANAADWFYEPVWEASPLPASTTGADGRWLIFADSLGWGTALAQQLDQQGAAVTCVRPGAGYAAAEDGTFTVRPDSQDDYRELLTALKEASEWPDYIIHAWGISQADTQDSTLELFAVEQQVGFYSLLYLTQALISQTMSVPCQINVLTSYMQAVGETPVDPEKATVLGLCRVIPQEFQNVRYRSIDIDLTAVTEDIPENLVSQLLREMINQTTEVAVAYRDDTRYIQQFVPKKPQPVNERLRPNGVYLITGGLGGIGLKLAEYLVGQYQANLILIGRSGLPAPETWDDWLAEHDQEDPVSDKIRQVQALRAVGSDVLVMAADVSNEAQIGAVIEAIYERYGRLHGVIHAAGYVARTAFPPIQETNHIVCEAHFQSKVYGLYILDKLLRDKEIDFHFFFSSLSSILGGLGVAAYSAANNFMDAYAHYRTQTGTASWINVNWDTWLVNEQEMSSLVGATVAEFAMSPAEGVEAFALALAGEDTHLVHSTGDLEARICQWVMLEGLTAVSTEPHANRPALDTVYVAAQGKLEKQIGRIWEEVLGIEGIGIHDNFFDLGGNSLIGLQVIARIQKEVGVPVSAVALFEAPTVSSLSRYLQPENEAEDDAAESEKEVYRQRRQQARQQVSEEGIAIVSMSGRFPGAQSVDAFWQNLCKGVESITRFSEEELLGAGVPAELVHDPDYVPVRPILEAPEQFDANFFGYSPREAELLDPQHRLFLQCAWEGLERAGYDPERYAGLIGVFAGANFSSYLLSWFADPQLSQTITPFQAGISNDKDSLTTRVSYKLNLRGPSLAVQTFCSTSLVATHLACQSLLSGECDMALAGGVSLTVPMIQGHLYQEGDQVSPDGHCRSFDKEAKGTVFGDGVGVVVLKRLSDALADGDPIQAVIKGSAVNNDGSLKVGYTAPSIVGQSEAVLQAWERAGIEPESLGYIEAHGTATELGDPVEVTSLTQAFRRTIDKQSFCALGSVKTNIGHLNQAAGVTGLIKAVLAVQHGEIPATLHFQSPNPALELESSPFYVNNQHQRWVQPEGQPRRAGVNSLGVGGTNAHVVIEEAPRRAREGEEETTRPYQLLLLSAKSEEALETATHNLATYLRQQPTVNMADVAYTLQVGRREFAYRRMVVCQGRADGQYALGAQPPQRVYSHMQPDVNRQVIFLFPGVGDHYVQMGRDLYEHEPYFREIVEECCAHLRPYLGDRVRDLLYPGEGRQQSLGVKAGQNGHNLRAMLGDKGQGEDAAARRLQETAVAQPVVFVMEYALARLLMSWGIRPQAMVGYSLGEYVAACLAGVMSVKDALKLVAERARLISALPAGKLLTVALSPTAVEPYVGEGVSVAIHNGANSCVLGGSAAALAPIAERCEAEGIACRYLATSHAFHTPQLAAAKEPLTALAGTLRLQPPRIPYLSNVTGRWITAEEVTDPAYWAEQMCQPVQFYAALETILAEEGALLLEVGAGQALGSFAKQHPQCSREQMGLILPTMPYGHQEESDLAFLLVTLGKLWLLGLSIEWRGYYQGERRQRLALPTYPFQTSPFWLQGKVSLLSATTEEKLDAVDDPTAIVSPPRLPLDEWFYLPVWNQTPPCPVAELDGSTEAAWLFFTEEDGIGEQLIQRLNTAEGTGIVVTSGQSYQQRGPDDFCIRAGVREDYTTLMEALQKQGLTISRVVHLWNAGVDEPGTVAIEHLEELLDRSFYSLMYLVQAAGEVGFDAFDLTVVTSPMHMVTGNETVSPVKTAVTGPCRTIPVEFPKIACRCIDIDRLPAAEWQKEALIANLWGELTAEIEETMVALRGHQRWVQAVEPIATPAVDMTAPAVLRSQGVYLLTGGLGGIGMGMAEYLAQTLQAKLILTGRSGLPPRESWSDLLVKEGEESAVGQKILQVQALEAAGAEVLVIAADVADEQQMQAAVQQALARFGTIHGVLHMAGVPGMGLIQLKTAETAGSVLAPKVKGTLVLERVLSEIPLDFLVLFSSETSFTGGGLGQIDYCAANAFMDVYAQSQMGQSRRTISINWGEWQWNAWEEGMEGFGPEIEDYFRKTRAHYGVTFAEGQEALVRVLAQPLPQVVVSTRDFRKIMAWSNKVTIEQILSIAKEGQDARPKHTRPSLGIPYEAPRNELEETIAVVWGDVLGIDEIGIHDDFFDLGGHSLIATQVMTRLRQQYQAHLPLSLVLTAPTVAELAIAIEMIFIEELEALGD